MDKPKMQELGALWVKTSSKGLVFMTGKIDGKDVVLFANKDKKDSQPDWRVYLSEKKEYQSSHNASPNAQNSTQDSDDGGIQVEVIPF